MLNKDSGNIWWKSIRYFHIHSFIHSFIHSVIHSFSHSYIPLIHSFFYASHHPSIYISIQTPIHQSAYPPIHPNIHPASQPAIHPSIRSFIHSFLRSFIHLFIHPSIHPSIHLLSSFVRSWFLFFPPCLLLPSISTPTHACAFVEWLAFIKFHGFEGSLKFEESLGEAPVKVGPKTSSWRKHRVRFQSRSPINEVSNMRAWLEHSIVNGKPRPVVNGEGVGDESGRKMGTRLPPPPSP